MISSARNNTTPRRGGAAKTATLGPVVASALLAGLTFAATEAHAIPTFGTFVNLGFAGTDGGMGVFSASKSYSFSGTQTSYTQGAVASLATGSLHSSTFASMDCATRGCPQSWGVGTEARLFDRFVFTNTGENIALIPVSLNVDGNCAGTAQTSAQYRFSFSSGPTNISNVPYHELSCEGETDVVAHINLLAFAGDTSFDAFVELSTGVSFNAYDQQHRFGLVDFGNTLKVEITLPPGVTMRSASGVFPSISATAVPEPATLAVLGAGLAGLGVARRRRVAVPKHYRLVSGIVLAGSLLAAGFAQAEPDDRRKRGEYLAAIMDCGGCHTPGALVGKPDQQRYLAGSDVGFEIPQLGVFYPPNLTPDRETGLGRWTEAEIIAAIRTGARPDGRLLVPIMPYQSYAKLSDADAQALVAYLKGMKPVRNRAPTIAGPSDKPTAPYLKLAVPD